MTQRQNIQDYDIFIAKKCSTTQSYLITLIDGTGSISSEYELIVQSHIQLYNQNFLDNLFLRGNYPKNIAFLFVSDGQESYNFEQLKDSIEKMKHKYDIQFISIAVGKDYPPQLNSQLRDKLHNQNASCDVNFFIPRPNNGNISLKELLSHEFKKIKEKLCVYQQRFQVDQPVQQLIGSEQTYTVFPDEPFIRASDGTKLKLDNQEITPTENPIHISLLILYSLQYQINQVIAWKSDQIKVFQNMYRIILSILSKMKICEKEKNEDVVQLVLPLLDVVQCFANGSLSVENLEESQKAHLQSKIKNREEIEKFIQVFKNKERKIESNLTQDNIIEDFIRDLNNLKFQRTSQKELFRKILHNIYDTLSKLKNIQQNQTQELRDKMKDILNKKNQKIFSLKNCLFIIIAKYEKQQK